jgi:hypothetical protein
MPTHNRPEKPHQFPSSLVQTWGQISFGAYVGDSSDVITMRKAVQAV